jgi:hypothetical protein
MMMTKRLAGLAFGLVMSVACSSGRAPEATAGGDAATSSEAPSADRAQAETKEGSPAAKRLRSSTGASEHAAAARPQFREVTIPAGTTLSLELETAVSSDKSRSEDPVRARLARPILIEDMTAVPAGAELHGSVLEARESGRVSGRASIAIRFDKLRSGEQSYDIQTSRIARQADSTKREDVKKVGIGAGAGAIIGAIAGGKKGAAIGGAVGAGAGTGVVMATRGKEIRLGPGATLKTTLEEPLTVMVPID